MDLSEALDIAKGIAPHSGWRMICSPKFRKRLDELPDAGEDAFRPSPALVGVEVEVNPDLGGDVCMIVDGKGDPVRFINVEGNTAYVLDTSRTKIGEWRDE